MIYFVLTFLVSLAFNALLASMAHYAGLVDKPDMRKRHAGEVPLVGGIAIFMAICTISLLNPSVVYTSPLLLGLSVLIVLLGVVDDLVSLKVLLRVFVQIVVASVMVVIMDVRIEHLGALFGGEPVELNIIASSVFTVLCVVGVINAINMIDGLDGLSGSILLVSFAALAWLAWRSGSEHALFLFCLCGALLAFLYYNARVFHERAVVFLGDSGSMFLGLVLVWAFVELSQADVPALTAVSAGWILGLPLIETVVLMVGRVVDKKSPFQAGRDHLHHKLIDAGFSTNRTVCVMLGLHIVLVTVGCLFADNNESDALLFWLFVSSTILYFLVMRNGYDMWRSNARLPE